MRPHGSPNALERRRRKAVALLAQNLSFHEVARRVGCHASSVLRWSRQQDQGGPEALKPKPAPGRPCRLTAGQKRRLEGYLLKGAVAQGYRTELWTTQRIAEVIQRRFGIVYHRDHVGRLLHQLGWSHQKPERRAVERNEALIAEWKRTVWPRIKKRRTAGSPYRLRRRIRLPVDSPGAQDLEPSRPHAPALPRLSP